MSNEVYFRPPWTCGKYNAEKHVAIMFNLLSRMNYFFEEESADVIYWVLAAGKNGKVLNSSHITYMVFEKNCAFYYIQFCRCFKPRP